MKTSIYSQRIELNKWEIKGIESYLASTFDLQDDFIYSDKTLHLDYEDLRFGIYKIGQEDLYFTIFHDNKENETFRLSLGTDQFTQIDENFEFIQYVENIFETL